MLALEGLFTGRWHHKMTRRHRGLSSTHTHTHTQRAVQPCCPLRLSGLSLGDRVGKRQDGMSKGGLANEEYLGQNQCLPKQRLLHRLSSQTMNSDSSWKWNNV